MKPKTIILMVVAIVCGLGASYGTTRLIANRKEKPAEQSIAVVYAKKSVPKFTRIEDPKEYFVIKKVPQSQAPKDHFSTLDKIKGRQLRQGLSKDQHLAQENILDGNHHPLNPPKGYGASALNVTAAATAGNFLRPGDRVNILWTGASRESKGETKALLRNVLVLAAGQVTQADVDEGTRTIESSTVTLALKTNESRLMYAAEKVGEIRMYLLNPKEEAVVEDREDLTEEELKKLVAELTGKQETANRGSLSGPPRTFGKVEDKKPEKPKDPNVEIIQHDHKIRFLSGNKAHHEYIYREKDGQVSVDNVAFRKRVKDEGKESDKTPEPKQADKPETKPEPEPGTGSDNRDPEQNN